MNVYYKNEWGELWHGDCLEVMDFLEIVGPVVDMVLCDPPYGTTECKWDAVLPFSEMWGRIARVTQKTTPVVLTASQPFTSALVASNLPGFRYGWVWDKVSVSNPQLAKYQPLKQHEDVLIFSKSPHTYRPQGLEDTVKPRKKDSSNLPNCHGRKDYTQTKTGYPRSILRFSSERGLHPTQKPVALFAYLIQTYTNPGGVVLDFCAGSGTTAVAAEMTGRRWILIEKEEKYCEIIAKRLAARRN